MTHSDTTHLLWCDLETNGSHEGAVVLEAAFVLTDHEFNVIWSQDALIHPNEFLEKPLFVVTSEAPSVVQEMHNESGLWADLKDAIDCDTAWNLNEFDTYISNRIEGTLMSYPDMTKLRLAGSGVSHFDSLLLKQHFPLTWANIDGFDDSAFLKPTMDMGVIRRFLQLCNITGLETLYPESPVGNAHRAYNDVFLFIDQARWLREHLRTITNFSESFLAYVEERKISRSE